MTNSYKLGGGNKMQPYIPAGNGRKSGQYANKHDNTIDAKPNLSHSGKTDDKHNYNFFKSKLVGKVMSTLISGKGISIPVKNIPNSVLKKVIDGHVITERYYNEKGEAYLDIDYTCHGCQKSHPYVPHIHKWEKDNAGLLIRKKMEKFK